MTDEIQLADDELQKISDLKDQLVELFGRLGQLKISESLLIDELDLVRKQTETTVQTYKELAKQEETLVMELTKKYGVGSLDLATGKLTPEK